MNLYTYYLCNEKDEKLIRFKARVCAQGFIIYKDDDIEILGAINKLPKRIQEILLNDKSEYKKVNALEMYLAKWAVTPIASGQILDELIQKEFGFSKDILCNGRLDSLWIIRNLIKTHFVEKDCKQGFYITSAKVYPISFVMRLAGADKLFIDKPITWNDVVERNLDVFNAQR